MPTKEQLLYKVSEVERQLQGIGRDAANKNIKLDVRNGLARDHLAAAARLMQTVREIDTVLGQMGVGRIVDMREAEAIRFFSQIIPPQQAVSNFGGATSSFNTAPFDSGQQTQYSYNTGAGFGFNQPSGLSGTLSFGNETDEKTLPGSRFNTGNPIVEQYNNSQQQAQATSLFAFGTPPVEPVKEEAKPVVKKAFDGSEYPLLLAAGLSVKVNENLGDYFRYEVVGEDNIYNRINKDSFNIITAEYDSKDITKKPTWYILRNEPKTYMLETYSIKQFCISADFFEDKKFDALIDFAKSSVNGSYREYIKFSNQLTSIYPMLGRIINGFASKRFIELYTFHMPDKNPYDLPSMDLAEELEETIALLTDSTLEAGIRAANIALLDTVMNYGRSLIANATYELVNNEEYVITIKDTNTTVCISNPYLVEDIRSIQSGTCRLVRKDGHKALYEIFTNLVNVSTSFELTKKAKIVIIDDTQTEYIFHLYLDVNNNFVIVRN